MTHPTYFYTDEVSGVSTKQFLALAWIAINDNTRRTGSLGDAQAQIIQALYEIKREYNFDEAGQDRGGADAAACSGGTFNKIGEKLHGQHPDVTILIITKTGALAKFQSLARELALAHLEGLKAQGKTAELSTLLREITDSDLGNTLGSLWDAIKGEVTNKMLEEFGSLYKKEAADPEADPEFIALLELGPNVELKLPADKLKALQSSAVSADSTAAAASSPPEQGKQITASRGTPDSSDKLKDVVSRISPLPQEKRGSD